MGVERSVTYWYIQRQTMLSEIASLESQLKQVSVPETLVNGQIGAVPDTKSAGLLLQLARARKKLSSLGPCPKPMMG
jgi:hypothetical protein